MTTAIDRGAFFSAARKKRDAHFTCRKLLVRSTTYAIWQTGEFGRNPVVEPGDGRALRETYAPVDRCPRVDPEQLDESRRALSPSHRQADLSLYIYHRNSSPRSAIHQVRLHGSGPDRPAYHLPWLCWGLHAYG